MITISIPGEPLACPRPRAVVRGKRAASYMPSEYTEAKQGIAWGIVGSLNGSRPAWLLCGARLSLVAVFPRPASRPATVGNLAWKSGARVRRLSRPDADNLWKAYADALTVALGCVGLVWDDALLEIGPTDRYYAAVGEAPGVVLRLDPLDAAEPCPMCHGEIRWRRVVEAGEPDTWEGECSGCRYEWNGVEAPDLDGWRRGNRS